MRIYKFIAPESLVASSKDAFEGIIRDTVARIDAVGADLQQDTPDGQRFSVLLPERPNGVNVFLAFSDALSAHKEKLPDDDPYKVSRGTSFSLGFEEDCTRIRVWDSVEPLI